MDLNLFLGLLVGLLLGAATGWLVLRARSGAADARAEASATVELARATSSAAEARAELERGRGDVAQAREDAANARREAAEWQASVAQHRARADAAERARVVAEERAAQLAADREALANQFKALSQETLERQGKAVDATTEARLKATEQLLLPVKESLQAFNSRLTEVEKERVRMAAELRGQVANVQLTGEQLRRETQALATALRKPQVRGSWGEMQLRRVAELAGMLDRCDFSEQSSQRTDDGMLRPDMTIHLTDGKSIYVDSKVPLSSLLDAFEAINVDDQPAADAAFAQFGSNIRTHVDQLGGKNYWQLSAAASPEFVVLFLPGEGFLQAALDNVPDLHEYAARRNVVVATPNTLIALLRTVAHVWRQAALTDSANAVLKTGRELYERLGTMGSHLDKLGRSLTTAVKSYNQAIGTVETRVFVTARKFQQMQVADADLESPRALDDAVRPLTAAELVADPVTELSLLRRPEPTLEQISEEVASADVDDEDGAVVRQLGRAQ